MGPLQRRDYSRPAQFTHKQCTFLNRKGGTKSDRPGSLSSLSASSINAERCRPMVWVFSLALTCSVGISTAPARELDLPVVLLVLRGREQDSLLGPLMVVAVAAESASGLPANPVACFGLTRTVAPAQPPVLCRFSL
jgi:hypothetical protein